MENEIKVNDFVRTSAGYIFKVLKISEEDKLIYYYGDQPEWIGEWKENIVKHSPKLIDIVKTGDYVNGRLVLQVDYKNQNVCLLIPFTDTMANTNIMWYGYEDIKTIATKEMMESISYKVTKM